MQNPTRKRFDAYKAQIARLNNISVDVVSSGGKFNVEPSVQQKLETFIQESSAFLKQVNLVGVDEMEGEKLGLSATSAIAGRTDLDRLRYKLYQTNFDTLLRYAKLDMWAKFPDFQVKIRNIIVQRQALDRLMIGWNGEQASVQSDRATYPLLQDVNIGWLKKLELEASQRFMTEGSVASEVRIGAGNATAGFGDYANLDVLVHDMRSNLLEPWHRRDSRFTCIVSSDLLDDKYFPLIGQYGGRPTESRALDGMLAKKRLGGLGVEEVPFFKERAIFITLLLAGGSNLSIYYQNGKRRRAIVDNAKRDQVENYESSNEAYVIEDLTAACACKNIKLWNEQTQEWY